jgi:hypothetical protein
VAPIWILANPVIVVRKKTLLTITNWSRRVVRKMFKGLRKDPFVCIDDISGRVESLNYVIYNPKQDTCERINLLYEKIKERFGVELTSEQLTNLTRYDVNHLPEFVKELKQIIRIAKG